MVYQFAPRKQKKIFPRNKIPTKKSFQKLEKGLEPSTY